MVTEEMQETLAILEIRDLEAQEIEEIVLTMPVVVVVPVVEVVEVVHIQVLVAEMGAMEGIHSMVLVVAGLVEIKILETDGGEKFPLAEGEIPL